MVWCGWMATSRVRVVLYLYCTKQICLSVYLAVSFSCYSICDAGSGAGRGQSRELVEVRVGMLAVSRLSVSRFSVIVLDIQSLRSPGREHDRGGQINRGHGPMSCPARGKSRGLGSFVIEWSVKGTPGQGGQKLHDRDHQQACGQSAYGIWM